ncbi:GNAT family N-acetyltransferase [Calycomorphotria hydatis]|uniref:Acetyltransferase (GNAT) family protein n=1 Tax=Calycomorphotria hydatis TaxID=2528027 RepID=A0A517TER4_9PLAN|nr:N-acetyltransferase [Calycomorphotria hydatis]QDT66868.1 Acetyltransferase (GNAT) family protein [Calycomorphotria hydatis]
MVLSIQEESAEDIAAIHAVNASAFETEDEANLVDELRAGRHVVISLTAKVDGNIVGHILFSRMEIVSSFQTIPALSLAPMAVLPAYQRQDIGSELVNHGLEVARRLGERIVIVLGHPDYYPRFGFSPELAVPLEAPFSGEAWMALELEEGALNGVAGRVKYAPPFGIE